MSGPDDDVLPIVWTYDWPDPGDVPNIFLGTKGYRPSWASPPFPLPSRYGRAFARAAVLRGASRDAAYRRLLVKLAREVAPFAAFATPVLPEFFSARLGCRVDQPVTGQVDIGALCSD